ncbi:ThiF family adenylyltransferase [Couchioplanes caeruleus]|uniref:ThiF family adenylyltransferase n=1 Tax=Couchioplanes caeruleus TaxID=56438 RepID=UPI0020C17E25|nr:ThiF family adenylyltransferase [Couchioplanes caeruleus]UQU62529.1 ThiF family adenylyltransferase [Couchioplanes caeruleus]
MSEDIYAALARTALLLERDVFGPGVDHRTIIDGLRATTVRVLADRRNVATPAGQTALVTLFGQLAMMGLQIDLDVPEIPLVAEQPPLRGGQLLGGMLDYADDLMPGGSSNARTPTVTFALGDTPASADAIRVSGTGWRADVGLRATSIAWNGDDQVGAMAAAAAAAADGLRAALPHTAERLGRPMPSAAGWRLLPERQVTLDLTDYRTGRPSQLGHVDVISGGAITNAALYALLRMGRTTAALRIIEPELLDLSNLNRYALARRSWIDTAKTTMLSSYTRNGLSITGVPTRFDHRAAQALAPIAKHVLVGVDHIPSRWLVQAAAPHSWIGIGASSHDFVLVSAHPSGAACAGCVHPKDDDTDGPIPTISFVSFWAGLIQALELTSSSRAARQSATRSTQVWPLGLHNLRGLHRYTQAPAPNCPLHCSMSRPGQAAA